MARGTVAASVARGLMQLAVAKGADPEALSRRAGLAPADLQDPDARIPAPNYVALMKAGQELAGDPALALHYAEQVDLTEVSVVGLLTHARETMRDAFAQISRYSRLVSDEDDDVGERMQIVPAGDGLDWLVDNRADPNLFPEATEICLGRLVCGPRVFDTTPFCKEVHVTHPAPSYRSEYDRIFRAPIVFESDRNALLIDASWHDHKIAPRQRYAFGVLSRHAEALLQRLEQSKTVRGRVESRLISSLHTGKVGMDAVAAELGFSRQTLLRRLKAEGATYEQVLDELRSRMASHYLDGRKVSISETAYLLGFSDRAAFTHAFKRWTGSSPRARREPNG